MKITAYPEDTSPANNDLLLTVDVSAGTNKKVTVTNIANAIANVANLPVNGWFSSTSSVSSVTYNGNRSYTMVTGTDLSSSLSAGMRLRTTRTVAAPTQCTSLNGSNQYYSKSSPAGMTFTDDFVVSAWIKVSSYATGVIASRYDGTSGSGWQFYMNADGTIALQGNNAASANLSRVTSYQSVPLNKWVHVAAQLDMSAFTATTTTSYVMIDGVDVPAVVARTGTNPTALVQAGNLFIGATNSAAPTAYFPGKIAQAAVYSAKVTQANVRATISQGLAGNETSLISAYSFNNAITDLNTSNANNLTANGSAVATNADSPFGGQADGTISSTLDYGIVQKISGTSITVQVAEGNTIPTTGGVSALAYSFHKSPYGFPTGSDKWEILFASWSDASQASPSGGTYYNLNGLKLTVPVGSYTLSLETAPSLGATAATGLGIYCGLSTSASSFSDRRLYSFSYVNQALDIHATINRRANITATTETSYYLVVSSLNTHAGGTLKSVTTFTPCFITAITSYL